MQNLELTCASPGVLPSSANFVRPFMRHQARALSALPLSLSLFCVQPVGSWGKSWWVDMESFCFWDSYWFKTIRGRIDRVSCLSLKRLVIMECGAPCCLTISELSDGLKCLILQIICLITMIVTVFPCGFLYPKH